MAISLKNAYGGGGSGYFPEVPRNVTTDPTSSQRIMMINDSSTDFIRFPAENNNNTLFNLGYRRIDSKGSGGVSEWLVSWQEIATFLSISVNDVANSTWGSACIRNGKFYALFLSGTASGSLENGRPFYVKCDLGTGAIESVVELQHTNVTLINQGNFYGLHNDGFWEVKNNGNFVFYFRPSFSLTAGTGGIPIIEMDADGVTVVSETEVGEYAGVLPDYGTDTSFEPTYASEDGKIMFCRSQQANGVHFLFVDDNDDEFYINIPAHFLGSGTDTLSSEFMSRLEAFGNDRYNVVSDSFVSLLCDFGDALATTIIKFTNRSDLDEYFRGVLFKITGKTI